MLFHLTASRPWSTAAQQAAAPEVRGTVQNVEVFHLREGFAEQSHQMALLQELVIVGHAKKEWGRGSQVRVRNQN